MIFQGVTRNSRFSTLVAVNSVSCSVMLEVRGQRTHKKKMSDFSKATLCDCLYTNNINKIGNSHEEGTKAPVGVKFYYARSLSSQWCKYIRRGLDT